MTERQVALVTGANKGIGRDITRQLAARGYTVWVAARDVERGGEAAAALAAEGDVRFVRLDVRDAASIAAAADHVRIESGRLDALVNNAGVAIDRAPPSALDLAVMRETYEVNVFGPAAVTQAFLPLLRESTAGRIVMMSSGLGSLTQQSDPAWAFYGFVALGYCTSKTALNAVTVAFAKELRDTPIKVNAADPGYVATDLNSHAGPRTVEQGAGIAVRLATLPDDGPTGGYFDENGPVPW